MTRPPSMTRLSGACVGLLLLTFFGTITLCASATNPKHIFILNPFGHYVAPYTAAVSAFRSTLAREFGEPVEFDEVALDLARHTGPEGEGPLVAFLESRLKNHPADLVVSFGGASVQFADRHRGRLFANTPFLVAAAEPRLLPPGFLSTNATLVTQHANIPGMVEDILQLQPDTTQIVVVFGASPLEKYWLDEFRREVQIFNDRITFAYLEDLSFDEVLKRCAVLPPRSFILHVFYLADSAGTPYENNEALRQLHQVANAPVFGYFASELGLGPIGGRLFHDSEIGVLSARAAIRILRGERPESIPPQLVEATAPVFDWRELQRWGISEARRPAGSIVQFRQPGFWDRYRRPITGMVLFGLLQTALIVGLLVNRARLRREEAAAALVADISSKFVNLQPSEVDREIMDAERRICEWLDLDLAALWQVSDESPDFFTLTHSHSS